MASLSRIFLLLSVLVLVSCAKQVPLFSDLREEEANEVMAALMDRAVDCTKVPGKEDKWALQVKSEDFSFAMQTLQAMGLPKQSFQRMGEIFQKSGLVSSPTEERIRFIYALGQELSETFMQIDGVVSARVHIALPDTDPLAEETNPASAAVFIKCRPGYNLANNTQDLKNLVTRSIEGLKPENVELVITSAELQEPIRPKEKESSTKSAGLLGSLPPWGVPAAAGGGGFLLATAVFLLIRRGKPKSSASA
ncbi:MAG: type III secretion system inner membrane ring lipoprotein SctJ [Verrucomicrobium sp.]|nr:type III secretion inner membrane ring lipoprotein SctJ [Verrucomicrobium sp.]